MVLIVYSYLDSERVVHETAASRRSHARSNRPRQPVRPCQPHATRTPKLAFESLTCARCVLLVRLPSILEATARQHAPSTLDLEAAFQSRACSALDFELV